jgi:hypothetical protein
MAMPTNAALPVARNEPRTRTALLSESIAPSHQIAALERSGARRPYFRLWDRLFWILLSRWWTQWREVVATHRTAKLNMRQKKFAEPRTESEAIHARA